MANDTVVRLTGDASGYVSEMERARRSAADFVTSQDTLRQRLTNSVAAIENTRNALKAQGDEAVASFNRTARTAENWLTSLQKQADQAGKTRAQLMELRAAELGVSDAAQPYIDKIKQAEAAMNGGAHAAEGLNFSTVAARRELLVLAHEASQGSWKNFGGSLLVLGERIDAMSMILSPLGLGIGAVGAAAALMATQIYEGYKSFEAFEAAIRSTSGALGLSTEQMMAMSAHLVDASTSTAAAREMLAGLASTGRVAGDDLELAGRAAVAMAVDTGMSAEKAIASITKLHENVIEWLKQYQDQHHVFNAAQVQEIENFARAGDAAAAQKAAMLDLAAAHEKIAQDADKNMGTVLGWWNDWKSIIDRVKTSIMNIGVPDGITKQVGDQLAVVEQVQRNINDQRRMGNNSAATAAERQLAVEMQRLNVLRDQQAVQFKAQRQKEQDARSGDAAVAVNAYLDSTKYASPLKQRNLAIKKENADYAAAVKDVDRTSTQFVEAEKRHADNLREIDKQYASRNGSKAAATAAATAAQIAISAQLASLDAQKKQIEDATRSSLEHIKALRQEGVISEQEALSQSYAAEQQALQKRIDIDKQQEVIAEGKKNKEAYRKYADDIERLQQQMVNNYSKFTDDIGLASEKEARAVQVYVDSLKEQLRTQQAAADMKLTGLSMGSTAKAQYDAEIKVMEDYDKKRAALAKSLSENKISKSQYNSDLKATQDYYDASLEIARRSSADILAANEDWTTGASRAIQNYADSASNIAAQVDTSFTSMAKSMEDAIANFVTTGKLNFTSLANSIIADIIRMQARAAMSGLFSSLAGLIGAGVAGSFGTLASTGSAASAASDVMGAGYSSGLMGPSSMMPTHASLPARASGGPVADGTAYMVGERGPEMFVPNQSGSIVPNHALGSNGGGVSVQIVNNSNAQVQQPQVSQDSSGRRFIRLIIDQAKSEIAGEMAGGQGNVSKALTQRYGLTPRFR
ncbi:phage tail tape measure protein [Burkholderia vietnamiensis]|uniref:phage tail tape measure protein n=1 Tax=Burkholderia vietnamiensis TaxID=60552 RepID=UPI001B9F5752|nr:phage tail tape measure protein [Burkholderia vietnamiensis]